MLRGNHESASITKVYGFFDECKRRIRTNGIKIWKTITDTFNCLPIAAIVGGQIFCVHGGLSPELTHFQQIASILRPTGKEIYNIAFVLMHILYACNYRYS